MSELRRNGGADDADKPAANDKAADKPVEHARLEIRTTDMDPERPVNRPLTTKAQRYYADLIKQAGDVPAVDSGNTGYVRAWDRGESLDDKYPNITGGRDRPTRGDTPEISADPADRFSDLTMRRRRADRVVGELAKEADTVVEHVGDAFKAFEDIFGPRPPGHAETKCDATPTSWPHEHVHQGASHSGVDVAMAIAAGGLVVTEASRKMIDRLQQRRDDRAGNG